MHVRSSQVPQTKSKCYRWLNGETGNFLEDMHRWLQEGDLNVQIHCTYSMQVFIAVLMFLFVCIYQMTI